MKYAIIEFSGKQFWIEVGKYYDFNKINVENRFTVLFNKILLLKNNDNILIGKPYLNNIQIEGKILNHFQGPKCIIYKMQPKKKTRKKQGHRQNLSRIFIKNIHYFDNKKINN